MYESFQDTGTRIFDDEVDDEILSSRPSHSNRKTIKTITRINLSSGRCLDLSFVGDSKPSIKLIYDTPSTSTQPKLTTRLEKPGSIISDISKRSKTSTKPKSRKSNKS